MNWRLKILTKIILARLPVRYQNWHRLGLFKHGHMHKPEYVVEVTKKHLDRLGGKSAISGKTCLELGPGDSLGGALVAKSYGADKIYMVDVGMFARTEINLHKDIISYLNALDTTTKLDSDFSSFNEMLEHFNIFYLTSTHDQFTSIADGTVDAIWSNAVLEHVRRENVPHTLAELFRILHEDGAMSHRIDYKDHLGGGLHNLRISSKLWESPLFSDSGFYTNRLRHSQYLEEFEGAGFSTQVLREDAWKETPITRASLSPEFANLQDRDLLVSGADLLVTKHLAEKNLNA